MMVFPAETGPHHDVFPHREFGEGAHHLVGPGQSPPGHFIRGLAGDIFTPKDHPALRPADRPR